MQIVEGAAQGATGYTVGDGVHSGGTGYTVEGQGTQYKHNYIYRMVRLGKKALPRGLKIPYIPITYKHLIYRYQDYSYY